MKYFKYLLLSLIVATSVNARSLDSSILNAGVDGSTNAIETIDYAHHEIHDGSHYYVQGYVELNDGVTLNIKLVTADSTKWSHFQFNIKSTGICATQLKEDATGGMTGGSSMVPINNNRNSTNTSNMILTSDVTACTGYTTLLENTKWGADGFRALIGGGTSREDELILKQDTIYCRQLVSGADGNIIQFKASWYEHTNKR